MPSYSLPDDMVNDLVGLFRGVTPQDVASINRTDNSDDIYALAEMMAIAECVDHNWRRMSRVSYADGRYLEIHAATVGLSKQAGETDAGLRNRIRSAPSAVTPDLIQAALQSIVTTAGFSGTVYLVELPLQGFYYKRKQCWNRGWRWSGPFGTVIALVPIAAASVLSQVYNTLLATRAAGKVALAQLYQ